MADIELTVVLRTGGRRQPAKVVWFFACPTDHSRNEVEFGQGDSGHRVARLHCGLCGFREIVAFVPGMELAVA